MTNVIKGQSYKMELNTVYGKKESVFTITGKTTHGDWKTTNANGTKSTLRKGFESKQIFTLLA